LSIGYACQLIGVQGTELSRCILKNATEDKLRELIKQNLKALDIMIDYNIKHDIHLFRISSDIIPFGSHPINKLSWWNEFEHTFSTIGNKIKSNKIRVSMHPGQYTVLNSPDQTTVSNAILDLEYHDRFLNALGMDQSSKMVLHIGGVYGDKKQAAKRFVENYQTLSDSIKSRLILENDDKSYTVEEVINIARQTGAPVVFDNLHNAINPSATNLSEREWILECRKTWKSMDGMQKIHYSQQGKNLPVGGHSETVYLHVFEEFYPSVPLETDIMLEVKDKNLSAIKCINSICLKAKAVELETEWARYKYYVLSCSASIYTEIRQLLKDKNAPAAKEFYSKIEAAMLLGEDMGAEVNAAEHVWGYISKDSTNAEKNRYQKLLSGYLNQVNSIAPVKKHLLACAIKRNLEYLVESYYFYI
jgi:UV DNA damage endonuclease